MKYDAAHLTEAIPGLASREPAPSDTSASSVLAEFLGPVVSLTGARAGAIRAPSEDGTHLRLLASVGLPAALCKDDALMPASCGMCGAAMRQDDMQQATFAEGCALRWDGSAADGSHSQAVAVPLDHGGRPIGVLNLFFSPGQEPPEGIRNLLQPFGLLLGLALENERLTRESLQARVAAERQSMAADIHDALAQSLTFVRMRMSLLHDALEETNTGAALSYWTDASDELRSVHGRLREMISMYRAGMDSRGLMASLAELVAVFHRRTGIELRFDCHVGDFELTAEQQLQVFYIVQESLANIGKHSGARHARLVIDRDGSDLRVTVEDDGRGPGDEILDPRLTGRLLEAGHHGLQIMRERAGRAGGRLKIGALPEGGTRVTLTIDSATRGDLR